MKLASGLTAMALAALALGSASSASAARVVTPVYFLGLSDIGTILGMNVSVANTYDYTFSLPGESSVLSQLQASIFGPTIEPISFTLYQGAPGSGTALGSSRLATGANLQSLMGGGNYYLELTHIEMDRELVSGSLQIAAAPEPSTWGLMLAGVGLSGLALRMARRRTAVARA